MRVKKALDEILHSNFPQLQPVDQEVLFPIEYRNKQASTVAMGRLFEQIARALYGGWHHDDRIKNGIPQGEHGDTPDIINFDSKEAIECKASRIGGSTNIYDTQILRFNNFQNSYQDIRSFQMYFAHSFEGIIKCKKKVPQLYPELVNHMHFAIRLPLSVINQLHQLPYHLPEQKMTRRYEERKDSIKNRPFPSCTVLYGSAVTSFFTQPENTLEHIGLNPKNFSHEYKDSPELKLQYPRKQIAIPSFPILTIEKK